MYTSNAIVVKISQFVLDKSILWSGSDKCSMRFSKISKTNRIKVVCGVDLTSVQ
jgi:hypothetical protein